MRWGWVGVLLILAIYRSIISWVNGIELHTGDTARIRTSVGYEVEERWGRVYVKVATGLGRPKLEVEVPKGQKINFGDEIIAVGSLKERVIGQPNAGFILIPSDFTIKHNKQNFMGVMAGVREKTILRVRRALPGDEGELLAGIVLGDTGNMSQLGTEHFRKVGLSHIIAASGYNVGVVIGWALALGLLVMNRRLVMLFVILVISLYMLLAGLQVAVVRAGIMGIGTIAGILAGRKNEGGWGLVVSALIMICIYPPWLQDISFQLSVAAMTGVISIQQGLISKLRRILPAGFAEGFGATLSAIVFTEPLVLHYFGSVSWVAPVVNGLILWLVPVVMQVGAVGMLVGWVSEIGGRICLWGAWPILRLMTTAASSVAGFQYASWQAGNVSWVGVGGYYLIVALVFFRAKLKKRHAKVGSK